MAISDVLSLVSAKGISILILQCKVCLPFQHEYESALYCIGGKAGPLGGTCGRHWTSDDWRGWPHPPPSLIPTPASLSLGMRLPDICVLYSHSLAWRTRCRGWRGTWTPLCPSHRRFCCGLCESTFPPPYNPRYTGYVSVV